MLVSKSTLSKGTQDGCNNFSSRSRCQRDLRQIVAPDTSCCGRDCSGGYLVRGYRQWATIDDNAPPSVLTATAKQPNRLPTSMCDDAVKIGLAILERHNGRVSRQLLDSFLTFGRSACDLNTVFVRVEGTADEQVFGEFRVRLIALKMDAASKTGRLTQ